jgi:SAM-dependent methyltransferase
MNKAKLKSYAPQARKDFIAAVEARAHSLGLSEMGGTLDIAPSEKKGDVTMIAGQAWPAKVHDQRQRLIKRMKKDGFAQTVEAVAYTWFNRFAALRYMEIHDCLDHGYRVLSSREGGLPEIIAHATDVAGSLPGLNASQIADMKLAGNQDGELYRRLLVAQCNALSKAMPFLFEHIDDESELLLPGNLERTDSVVAKLVESIAEEDWSEVEVIGWLYQFYISEKKDAVIGKVVKSEDIPAATQLFTPNWIVQYLVQNSVGRLWLMANPASTLKNQWKYYIEPAEQTPEVQAQLDALIQTRMAEDGGSLNPETITVLDPACGSGHILVEAYEVLKAIYLERGYQARAIPRLILEKNLFGLDIDDRAAQMAGFALMMKARADDRRLLDSPIKLNVLSLQESRGLELDEFDSHLKPFGISRTLLASLIDTFAHAKTFGSLIQIPEALDGGLPALMEGLDAAIQSGDVFAQAAAQDLLPIVTQATVLATKFDAVVANPPYMGGKGMNADIKDFAKVNFPDSKPDLFAMFIERGFGWCKRSGFNSMVTMQSWMFLSSFEAMRKKLLDLRSLVSLVQLPYDGKKPTAMGISFGISVFVFQTQKVAGFQCSFDCFRYFELTDEGLPRCFPSRNERNVLAQPDAFEKIPGSPVAYWVPKPLLDIYASIPQLYESSISDGQNITADNAKYVRFIWEIDSRKLGKTGKWIYYAKGGAFRRWFGNNDYVVDWTCEARNAYRENSSARIIPEYLWFSCGITWTLITSSRVSFRLLHQDGTFDKTGSSIFMRDVSDIQATLAFLNSCVADYLLKIFSSTVALQVDEVRRLPFRPADWRTSKVARNADELCSIAKTDWDSQETSRDFLMLGWAHKSPALGSSSEAWATWELNSSGAISRVRTLEEENNRLFIDAYGLQGELSPDVPEEQITLTRADRENDNKRLISYAIGCMMGRYSLDEPGLIYANAGNMSFDVTRYKTFPADVDGIVPISDELWFEDDATNRVREFLNAVWGAETLEENMDWLAESLGKKGTETPEETIRRYLSGSFYKDHLQTYKKRPIYWHFSSGKQGAFQALVYLHRYHEGTLARMRAEYVVPLTGKMQSRIEMLGKDLDAASATATRTKIAKQIESLRKKHVELLAYDEKLRHYADMRIQLNLDDGVKVNYGKFGDLLAEMKAVTGGSSDE